MVQKNFCDECSEEITGDNIKLTLRIKSINPEKLSYDPMWWVEKEFCKPSCAFNYIKGYAHERIKDEIFP